MTACCPAHALVPRYPPLPIPSLFRRSCFFHHPLKTQKGRGEVQERKGRGLVFAFLVSVAHLDPTVVQANGEPTRKPPNSSGTDNLSQVYESRRFLRTLRGVLRETKRFSAFQITVPQFWTLEESQRMVDQRSMNPLNREYNSASCFPLPSQAFEPCRSRRTSKNVPRESERRSAVSYRPDAWNPPEVRANG